MTIQEENIQSFLIGLKELCVEHNLIIVGNEIELNQLPADYEQRIYIVDSEGGNLEFTTQKEIDYWVSKHVMNEDTLIKGKL